MDIPLPEVDRVAKLVPNIPGKPVTIQEALEGVPAFKEAYESAPYIRDLIDTATRLEGVARNAGTHAAGVIITDEPLTNYVPLHRPTKGSAEDSPIGAVTQFEMQVLDSLGLLKVDFLGLSTLTVMARACEQIRRRHGVALDLHSIPLDDPATFDLLGRGDVLGVFQVEGAGMRRYLMEMKPRALAHIVAMVALYRPGPIEFIPEYIRRMHGEEPVVYRHESLQPILQETYGITVYQEQIMYTAMQLAGYSASEADFLRKAVAKKKAEALHQERDRFVKGAVGNGLSNSTANAIFDDWEAFARYGFPKGHAADYAVICVQTAHLKAHYPTEYMAALMSVFKADTDKVALYIVDCRRMGIEVLPPDVNAGGLDFEIEDRPGGKAAIRFGMAAIKNVGVGPVQAILEARERGGRFADVEDFARRVDLRLVGKRALECLARVGAFDSLCPRCNLLDAADRLISLSTAHFRAAEVGQLSLFGGTTGVSERLEMPASGGGVSPRQQLTWEKELLGVYLSDHPLTPYMDTLTQVVTHFSAELGEAEHGQAVTVAGEVSHLRPYQTRTGKTMGFVTLEDLQGSIELVVFTRVWTDVSRWLTPGSIVLVRGKVDSERGDPKVLADEITREFTMVQPVSRPAVASEPEPAEEAWAPDEIVEVWPEADVVVSAAASADEPAPAARPARSQRRPGWRDLAGSLRTGPSPERSPGGADASHRAADGRVGRRPAHGHGAPALHRRPRARRAAYAARAWSADIVSWSGSLRLPRVRGLPALPSRVPQLNHRLLRRIEARADHAARRRFGAGRSAADPVERPGGPTHFAGGKVHAHRHSDRRGRRPRAEPGDQGSGAPADRRRSCGSGHPSRLGRAAEMPAGGS